MADRKQATGAPPRDGGDHWLWLLLAIAYLVALFATVQACVEATGLPDRGMACDWNSKS